MVKEKCHAPQAAMPLLDPNQSYTFSRYFELGFEASELAQEFGYKLTRKTLNLPQFPGELDRLQELRDRIEEVLPFVPLTNELARREILISRVVTELIHYTQAQLRIEYGLKVSNWLLKFISPLVEPKQKSAPQRRALFYLTTD